MNKQMIVRFMLGSVSDVYNPTSAGIGFEVRAPNCNCKSCWRPSDLYEDAVYADWNCNSDKQR